MTAPHLEPGQVVASKYTIRSLLGFSGAVATYRAADPQGVEVALKLLDPAIGQRADLMSALERAHRLTAALSPETVVPILDAGYDQGTGAPFTTTEWLTTPSLAKLTESGPLAGEIVANVLRGVAATLDPAHGCGLMHHSIKPTNIFVGPAPQYAVRVTDFGASVIRGGIPSSQAYVQCAPWWAPEQLQQGAPLGAQTDVFSVALVTFFALTGRSFWKSCQYLPPDVKAWQQEVVAARPSASR